MVRTVSCSSCAIRLFISLSILCYAIQAIEVFIGLLWCTCSCSLCHHRLRGINGDTSYGSLALLSDFFPPQL